MEDQYESSPDFQQDTIIEEVGSGKLLQNSKSLIQQQLQLPASSVSSAGNVNAVLCVINEFKLWRFSRY